MCTTIYWHQANATLLANNEDIFLETGFVFTNQRGIAKTALILPPDLTLTWVSQFGSLGFSQCGKEFPSAGMNEAGLVIEQMTLPETAYPAADDRPAVKELPIIQFLLDTCASVSEALSKMASVRIAQASAVVHYFLADPAGDSAVVEFLGGKMQVFQGEALPVKALTNTSYAGSLRALEAGEGNDLTINEYQRDSLRRFKIAARASRETLAADATGQAFKALAEAARPDTTWRIVYDLANRVVYIQTKWNPVVRTVTLPAFDFSPSQPGQVYDLQWAGQGNIEGAFKPYSTALNQELVYSFFRNETILKVFGMALPDEILSGFAAYPETLRPAM